jgi:NADPH-dependent glutamate synthase beta subunit-like oxidoreductase
MLRTAISRKRLPEEALDDDIKEILNLGVRLKLNCGDMTIDRLFDEGFDSVLLAIGSTFVGPGAQWLKDQSIDLTEQGTLQVESYNMGTSREGVFAAGDAALRAIGQDFIAKEKKDASWEFFDSLVEGLAKNRGDSFRSATKAIASGKRAAEAIDQFLGGDGDLSESFLPAEAPPDPHLGRREGFAAERRRVAAFCDPVPQYAALSPAEAPVEAEVATEEAKRCLRCDLRTKIKPVKFWGEYS